MDVLVHNCSIFYAQLMMETAVPFFRKLLAKAFKLPLSRKGQVIAQSQTGIFKRPGDVSNHMKSYLQ